MTGIRAVIYPVHDPDFPGKLEHRDLFVAEAVKLAEWAMTSRAEVFVIASSSLVYGPHQVGVSHVTIPDPIGPIGETMLALEEAVTALVETSPMRLVSLRLPHVYGRRSALFKYVVEGSLPFAGDPDTVFSHLHVDDAARALIRSIDAGAEGPLPVADHEPVSWASFLGYLAQRREGLMVHTLSLEAMARAARLHGDGLAAIPSGITPGTGWNWRQDQRIDSSIAWQRLGIAPWHPTYRSGIDSSLFINETESARVAV